ncbi:F-box/WD repeat-containing protein 8 isoform X2 [Thalassophryne amazonica]|uniref:F-box/WD repeat-containing protein 8 isoform X2 n=1 Tax=Thalassophryne amazonica TaxID=390379 RepID=UPI0014715A69|nr:F-box/WD repeat-containing protein 8 isoform X2 [Thalassophryne amazonica]
MAEDDLEAFRERWKRELSCKKEASAPISPTSLSVPGEPGQRDSKNRYFEDLNIPSIQEQRGSRRTKSGEGGGERSDEGGDAPQYVSIASSLLDGRTSPLLDRIQEERIRRKRQHQNMSDVCSPPSLQPNRKASKGKELVDQLIQDLNEVSDIPFFDAELPYELALKIFQYLNCAELGRCAQVSRPWKVLAEDSVLWFRLCVREGYHQDACLSDSPCWKSTLRDCRNSARTVCSNWKNRVGSITQLQFELGKVLCDASSCDSFIFAGYTSGDVRLWGTLHWDSTASYLKANSLSLNSNPRPYVSHVQVNSTVAAAAYEDGCVDLWSTEMGGEPIYHYQNPGKIQALVLSTDSPVLACTAGGDVRIDSADNRGYWRRLCHAHLPKTIHVYSIETGQTTVCVGNSPGDFICINLADGPPNLLACGNKDRRVRVFDLRSGSSVASLYAHHLGVTTVQADDWKIVSGGGEGLVCVWEMRTGAKLWEMHNRHPVRHVRFYSSTLVTANIPDDKSPRGACITDDDLTAHRRHRGVICHYDFSEDASSQDHILPICRSNYTESTGYNYNISLAVPYDRLSGSHPSH